jgi:hypothetical protein
MKKTRMLLLFVLLFAMPAMASFHTEPFIVNSLMLSEILFLVSITCLTAVGGGYKILETRKKILSAISLGIFMAIVLYFSLVDISIMMLIIICFSVYALARAVRMIKWGLSARSPNPPEHLESAQPRRLFIVSALLIIATVILCSFSVAAYQRGILYRLRTPYIAKVIAPFLCYELAYGELQKEETGKTRFDPFIVSASLLDVSVEVEFSGNLDTFTLYLSPNSFIPIWPYNYIFTIPVYRADETGEVRETFVTDVGQRCPEDAPVYRKYGDSEGISHYYNAMKLGRCDLPEGFERKK